MTQLYAVLFRSGDHKSDHRLNSVHMLKTSIVHDQWIILINAKN